MKTKARITKEKKVDHYWSINHKWGKMDFKYISVFFPKFAQIPCSGSFLLYSEYLKCLYLKMLEIYHDSDCIIWLQKFQLIHC